MNDPSSSSGTYEPGHPTQPSTDPAPQAQSPWQPPPAAPRRSNRVQWIAAAVLLVLILGGVWFFRDRLPGSAADLAVGNCFDEPVATDDITDVQRQPCNEPHDAEIVAVVGYDGETYPIQMQIERFVSERCVPAFESYTGRPVQDETEYDVGAFYPARSSWNDGDREVTCYAYRVDGEKLTDSIRSN